MRPVEIRKTPRCIDRSLAVVSGVESCVARRSRVDVLGEGVSNLYVVAAPAPRQGSLQRMVDRVRIVREYLVAGIPVQSWSGRSGDRVGEGVRRDGIAVAIDIFHDHRI